MDRTQTEAVKFKILERRNYLKDVDTSLKHSKRNLYGGMQARIDRRVDRSFHKDIVKRKELIEKKLLTVNKHLDKLSEYDKNIIAYNKELAAYNEVINTPIENGIASAPLSTVPISPIRPSCLPIAIGTSPQKKVAARGLRIGIKSRGRR